MRSAFQLKTYISFISFKTRGRKDSIKWKAVFLFVKDQQKKLVCDKADKDGHLVPCVLNIFNIHSN